MESKRKEHFRKELESFNESIDTPKKLSQETLEWIIERNLFLETSWNTRATRLIDIATGTKNDDERKAKKERIQRTFEKSYGPSITIDQKNEAETIAEISTLLDLPDDLSVGKYLKIYNKSKQYEKIDFFKFLAGIEKSKSDYYDHYLQADYETEYLEQVFLEYLKTGEMSDGRKFTEEEIKNIESLVKEMMKEKSRTNVVVLEEKKELVESSLESAKVSAEISKQVIDDPNNPRPDGENATAVVSPLEPVTQELTTQLQVAQANITTLPLTTEVGITPTLKSKDLISQLTLGEGSDTSPEISSEPAQGVMSSTEPSVPSGPSEPSESGTDIENIEPTSSQNSSLAHLSVSGAPVAPEIIHKDAITVFFNDATNPSWDPDLRKNIDSAKQFLNGSSINGYIDAIIAKEGPEILVLKRVKDGNIDEFNEIMQLHFSLNRNMARGPRVSMAGISLAALTGQQSGGQVPNDLKIPFKPTINTSSLANSWNNLKHRQGANNSGPIAQLIDPHLKGQEKLRLTKEAGPGIHERNIPVIRVAAQKRGFIKDCQ